jgi:hypothetical protein
MKNNIKLNIDHNNAKRMEFFLNRVEEELVEVPFEWRNWKNSEQIHDACKFISTDSKEPVTICVLFCDSYQDANQIGRENELPSLPTAKWSINGDVLYFVESNDAEKVSEILSLFAGEE